MKTIKELRLEKGVSQFHLAMAIGVTPSSIHDWEFGKKTPGDERLRRLAEFFCVHVDDILLTRKNHAGT